VSDNMKRLFKVLLLVFSLTCFYNVNARTYTEKEYKDLGIKRSYIVCDYLFDLSDINPTLKDLLLASQSCKPDQVSIYEIKFAKNVNGKETKTYRELLTDKELNTFPKIDLKYLYKSSIGTSDNKEIVDGNQSDVTHDLITVNLNSNEYSDLDLQRTYVVGGYMFNINDHNPTLQDLMIANQTNPNGEAKIIEIKYANDINNNETKTYRELLTNKNLEQFPNLDTRFVMSSEINPTSHDTEDKIDLLNNQGGNEVLDILVSEGDFDIVIGDTRKLTTTVVPDTVSNKNVTWSSSNTDVLTVDKNGNVSAKTSGDVVITITASNGFTKKLNVKVIDENTEATILCENKVFNQSAQPIAVCSGGTVENQIQTNGGDYKITCKGDDYHTDATPVTCKILRTDTVTTLYDQEVTYDGNTKPKATGARSTYSSTGNDISDAEYIYYYYYEDDGRCSNNGTIVAPINAGDYYAKAVLVLNTDYNSSESSCIKFKVNKKEDPVTITYKEVDYNGQRVLASTTSETEVDVTYYSDEYCTNKTSLDEAYEVGDAPFAGGVYYVKATSNVDNSPNYIGLTTECTKALTIKKVSATCPIISPYEEDYDGGSHGINVSSGDFGGVIEYSVDDGTTWTDVAPTRRYGGTTNVKVRVKGDLSHETKDCGSSYIKINKLEDNFTFTNKETAYTSEPINADVTSESGVDVLVHYYTNLTCTEPAPNNEAIAAKQYYILVETEGNDIYEAHAINQEECKAGLNIIKASTKTELPDFDLTYDGNQKVASGASSYLLSTDPNKEINNPTYNYTYHLNSACDETVDVNNIAPRDAGTYYVKATLASNDNYETSYACKLYKIKKATNVITVTEKEKTYDEDETPLSAVFTSDSDPTGASISVTYYSDNKCEVLTTASNATGIGGIPKTAGVYYATAKTTVDDNYELAELSCTKAVTINKADSTVTCLSDIYYKNKNGEVDTTNHPSGIEQNIASCNFGTIRNNLQTNAGSYTVKCLESENHKEARQNCTINKSSTETLMRDVVREYNGESQEADINLDNIRSKLTNTPESSFIGDYTFTYHTDDECTSSNIGAPTSAGTYYVKATLTGTNNYASSSVCAKYTITNDPVNTVTITTDSNGNVPTYNYNGTVREAIATTKSGDGTITYEYFTDSSCYANTKCSVNGCTSGNNQNDAGLAPTGAGDYYVIATVRGATNYDDYTSNCLHAFSIIGEPSVCPVVANKDRTYDRTTKPLLEVTTEASGGVAEYRVMPTEEWHTDIPERKDAGIYTVEMHVKGDIGHEDMACGTANITISKAQDTVTVNPITVTYDGANHYTSATASSGERAITINYYTDSSCNNSVDEVKNAKVYYAIARTVGNDNYKEATSGCVLAVTINKAPVTCPTITSVNVPYDEENHYITVTTPVVGGTIEYSLDQNSWSTTNPGKVNVGTYPVYVRVNNMDGNYETGTCGSANIVITKAPSRITCLNPIYNGNSQTIASCYGCTSINNASKVEGGTYTVTAIGDSNHTNISGDCDITPSDTTTTLPNITKTYNGSPQPASGATSKIASNNSNISNPTYTYYYFTDNSCHEGMDVAPSRGGVYYVKALLTETNNYHSSYSTCAKYTMNEPAYPNATITCTNPTYDGTEKVIATCNGTTIMSEKRTDAGIYEVLCSGDGNTYSTNVVRNNCELKKANATCPTITNYSGNVDNNYHTITVNNNHVGGTVEYSTDNTNWSTIKPKRREAGTTTIYVRVFGDTNHNTTNCGTNTITLTVAPKPKATITCNNNTYNGSIQTIATCNGGLISNEQQKNAGSYVITCTGDATHSDADSKTCPINKKEGACPVMNSTTVKYDGHPHSIESTPGMSGPVQYSTDNSNWVNTKPTRTAVGTTTIYVRIVENTNYTGKTCGSRTVTITN